MPMRIIAGEFRRRLIRGPEGNDTRPMTDRVRTSLFDRLNSMGMLDGGYAIDIFAGTGSAGLEALSRGIDHVTFIERDRSARKLLDENLADLGLTPRATVLATNALSPAWLNLLPHKPVDLIFCDPPYPMSRAEESRPSLVQMMDYVFDVSAPGALLILRTDEYTPPLESQKWGEPQTFEHGSMMLYFYSKA